MSIKEPVRLGKKDNVDNDFFCDSSSKIEAWCNNHVSFLLLVSIIIFSLLFVALCYAIIGVSATESGTVYNQFNRIV